ncbi:MAG: formylmethanofuran dehydrogenase [Anaerolineaceae bacterium]|nr:formylmethanofuran dehydrogenase [Anaerolineaceae bacterium]
MINIQELLQVSSRRHSHLCPRQVLGVRMALAGADSLGLDLPRTDKNLLVIAETDGCFVDGLEVTAGVSAGRRTLRIEDYGKVGATFINVSTGEAVRLAPQPDVRQRAHFYAPNETQAYAAQLHGYQIMPDQELFSIRSVNLNPSIEEIVSRPGVRVNCSVCGEEIINEREIIVDGFAYCRTCLGTGYYHEKDVIYPVIIEAAQLFTNS